MIFDKKFFNLKELIEKQKKINDKFPNPNQGSKYINVFDNMAGQIGEEIIEFNAEIDDTINTGLVAYTTNQKIEVLEELSDIIMYTASLFIETEKSLEGFNLNEFLDKYNCNNYQIIDSEEPAFLITFHKINSNFLFNIRRKIYDRKYHKPAPPKPENYEENLFKLMIDEIYGETSDLRKALNKMYYWGSIEISTLNKIIEDKENFIASL